MVNYNLGKIYKIVDNTNNNVYIGSTCEPTLARRLAKHIGNFKSYKKGNCRYISSFKIFENENYNIVLIEDYPCENKNQLYARERYWTENINCININRNQGIIHELGGLQEYNKEYKKEYYQKNKDLLCLKFKEYYKEYYQNNKAKLNEKFICYCGGCFTKKNKSNHIKSKKHQAYLENN